MGLALVLDVPERTASFAQPRLFATQRSSRYRTSSIADHSATQVTSSTKEMSRVPASRGSTTRRISAMQIADSAENIGEPTGSQILQKFFTAINWLIPTFSKIATSNFLSMDVVTTQAVARHRIVSCNRLIEAYAR